METLSSFLDIDQFMPHGMCFLWRTDLLLLHAGSDMLIALAYFSIPAAMITLLRARPDFPNRIMLLFASFILLCGVTHVASVVTIWYPAYYVEGLFKLATAIVSIATAIILWPLIPRAIALPSRQQIESRNQQIEQLNRRLQQRIDSLTTLAGGVSHDFNNMLTVIRGHAELMQQTTVDADSKESLAAILESSNKATNICRQMLAYSGRGHFILSPVDLNAAINKLQLEKGHTDIVYSLASDLPPIQAADTQIDQLLLDICQNAVEAVEANTGRGRIDITTHVATVSRDMLSRAAFETDFAPGEAVMLEVKDNGTGMSRKVIERLFEPYFSTKFTGRGLGMAAVQGIVRGHGACLFIDTIEGEGTTVRIAFPRKDRAVVLYRTPRSEAPKTMLLVDDEAQVRGLAATYLKELGITVFSAATRDEALRLARKHEGEIDAILVDYLMPGVNGIELIEALKEIDDVDAYLTSGYSRGEIDEPALRLLLTGFIPKPFNQADFVRLFRPVKSADTTGADP